MHHFGDKYLCISSNHWSFYLIIFKTNHISFTLKRIPKSSDFDSSVSSVIYVTCVYHIHVVYHILKHCVIFVLAVLLLDEKNNC